MVLRYLLDIIHEATDTRHLPLIKRDAELSPLKKGIFGALIPILVLLSGVFAGLTLGYMSLDETQLQVLATSGTEKQKEYANKIIPIRKNGHLLLITLILANMIVNESLPVIADPVFRGGIQAVVASTALIVIFAEIIPQTLCTRYGLVIGAKMAPFVRGLIVIFWVIAFPVSKLLEFILGPHHGIIYRRSELKELIAMHADDHPIKGGGTLKHDTAAIIGHTLDLQEKVVSDAMTKIEDVFMLSLDSVLDYPTLTRIHKTGHSRIPVFTEVDVPSQGKIARPEKLKKIIGVLLVKQCVLLDPEDATPLRSIPLNKVPPIAWDEPLLNVLDRFQEGRSHMAVVCRVSSRRAASVKEVVKPALTRRFLNKFRDSDSSDDEDLEKGEKVGKVEKVENGAPPAKMERKVSATPGKLLEQTMPADALLPKANVQKFMAGFDQLTNPLGIITLEDVLEELIGEEIYDEFDLRGPHALPASTYVPPEAAQAAAELLKSAPQNLHPPMLEISTNTEPLLPSNAMKAKPTTLKMPLPKMPTMLTGGFGMLKTRSAPGTPRGGVHELPPEGTLEGVVVNHAGATTEEPAQLDRIKEVQTPPSSAEGTQFVLDQGPHINSGSTSKGTGMAPARAGSVDNGLKAVPAIAIDRARSSSTPPSPHRLAAPLSTPGVAGASLNPAVANTINRTGSPSSSMLTEAVLRGRQARLVAAGGNMDGTLTPGGRNTAKGRFKSTPIGSADFAAATQKNSALNPKSETPPAVPSEMLTENIE